MSDPTARTQIPVELGMVERLDAMIAAPGPLDSYTAVVNWAADVARECGTPDDWAHAERHEVHEAATRGGLVLIEVDDTVRRLLGVVLGMAQGIVTYAPTYGTAIGWLLDVAQSAGRMAPRDMPPAPAESWAFRAQGSVNMHRYALGTTEADARQDAQARATALRQPVTVYRRPGSDSGARFGPEWVRHSQCQPSTGQETAADI